MRAKHASLSTLHSYLSVAVLSHNPTRLYCYLQTLLKSFYDILGVSKFASQEEIKKAYILRSKMMHPDRFHQTSQKDEWEMANEMLKELNQAYGVLKDSLNRREYDATREKESYSPPPQQSYNDSRQYTPPPRSYTAPPHRNNEYTPPPRKSPTSIPSWFFYLIFFGAVGLVSKGCDAISNRAPSTPSNLSAGTKPSSAPVQYTSPSAPTPIPADYPEPANGFVFKNALPAGGHGSLKISNGCPTHAVVKLVDIIKDQAVYVVFVRANSDFKIPDIPDGRYRLLFAAGHGWDDVDGRFREREGSSAFEQSLNYTTEKRTQADGVYSYSHRMEVTLNSVAGGTALTKNINTSDFEKY